MTPPEDEAFVRALEEATESTHNVDLKIASLAAFCRHTLMRLEALERPSHA